MFVAGEKSHHIRNKLYTFPDISQLPHFEMFFSLLSANISDSLKLKSMLLQLAVDLVRKKEAHIGPGYQPIISQAGLTANAAAQAAAKSVSEPSGLLVW